MITDEKRAFKRAKRKFTVRYRSQDPGAGPGGTAVSENISLGGVYFVTIERFDIGQILDCWIKIPGAKDEGRWTARVVRCENIDDKMVNTYGVAVEFTRHFDRAEKDLKNALSAGSAK